MTAPRYTAPEYGKEAFHCPYCGVFADQRWESELVAYGSFGLLHRRDELVEGHWHQGMDQVHRVLLPIAAAFCWSCRRVSYWIENRMIMPVGGAGPPPDPDMPVAVRDDYDEARDLATRSPRAAAALLRLALQRLMPDLGETSGNLNDDIGALVEKGLPVTIQQAADSLRVVGNNAVHPGELDLNDSPETVAGLFELINLIVDNRIAQPKRVEAIFGKLPEGARDAITKRDARSQDDS